MLTDTTFQKYQKKKQEIEKARLKAFCSAQVSSVFGIKCNPLTCRAWVDLRLVENGLFEGVPSVEAICQYLFRVSVSYPLSGWRKFKIERRVRRACKDGQRFTELIESIAGHLRGAFDELPEGNKSGGAFNAKIAPVESAVSAADELAARYGQHPDVILDMPMSQMFALQKAARIATVPGYRLFEPIALRNIKSEHLRKQNSGKD